MSKRSPTYTTEHTCTLPGNGDTARKIERTSACARVVDPSCAVELELCAHAREGGVGLDLYLVLEEFERGNDHNLKELRTDGLLEVGKGARMEVRITGISPELHLLRWPGRT